MRLLRFGLLAVAALLPLVSGCSRFEGMATRYRAERMVWEAQREETRLRIGKAAPDSATMLKIRSEYQKLRLTFHPPFIEGSGKDVERLRRDIARQVGGAELTASRSALFARRPDLALESARWVASIAQADTGLQREADLATVMALRGLRRNDEAIAAMRAMLDRYPPVASPTPEREDQILSIPTRSSTFAPRWGTPRAWERTGRTRSLTTGGFSRAAPRRSSSRRCAPG